MEIFVEVLEAHRETMLGAAVRAAQRLGVFELLAERDGNGGLAVEPAANTLDVAVPRLARLLELLAAEGILQRRHGERGVVFSRGAERRLPDRPAGDWEMLADVIRSDRPLAEREDARADFQRHLAGVGAEPARRLWRELRLGPGRLLDVGGGLGTYSLAFLEADERNRAVVVDLPPVIELLGDETHAGHPRLQAVACDGCRFAETEAFEVALLSNVLHLLDDESCRALLRRAARAVVPGGTVVVKDVHLARDRSGPLLGLYFALNMALYTEAGDVRPPGEISSWLRAAGLDEVSVTARPHLGGAMWVTGTKGA
jgi:SAM-dependent methyltransferase